jgi:hypothetical protein
MLREDEYLPARQVLAIYEDHSVRFILLKIPLKFTGLIEPVPRVYLAAQVLKTGVVLADLPGTDKVKISLI